MEPNAENRLLGVLSGAGESQNDRLATSRIGWRLRDIEESVAAIFGGRAHRRVGSHLRPDVLIERSEGEPIAAEVKVVDPSSLSTNLRNRINDLTARSVELRRAFSEPVVLCAILLIPGPLARPDLLLDAAFAERLSQLLRQPDGVGYESLIVGYASDELRWHYLSVDDEHGLSPNGLPPAVQVDEVVARLRGQQAAAPVRTHRRPDSEALRILFVSDEWRSGRGGISTINRELAIAVATLDAEVAVMVPACTEDDQNAAAQAHVALVMPARVEGLTRRELMLLKPRFAEADWAPDVVVGHGRVLGPYAKAVQQEHFPDASRVHVVHTAVEPLEAAKESLGGPSRMITANERATLEYDLARSADVVVAIGPLLSDSTRDELIGGPGTPPRVLELVPGLWVAKEDTPVPTRNQVLMVGRAEDFHSKGVDIAVNALLQVAARWSDTQLHRPSLVLRGVPDEAANEIKLRIESVVQERFDVFLRPYAESEDVVRADFQRSKVVLMPSRHEGFGLSAYEAIGAGVPVLISDESGLAMFLTNRGLDTSPSSIVATWGLGSDEVANAWAGRIEEILRNPEEARLRVIELRQAIKTVTSWEKCAAEFLDAVKNVS